MAAVNRQYRCVFCNKEGDVLDFIRNRHEEEQGRKPYISCGRCLKDKIEAPSIAYPMIEEVLKNLINGIAAINRHRADPTVLFRHGN